MATKSSKGDGEVLLTGATGFIGRRVAEALIRRGRRLALLCRPCSAPRLDDFLGSLPKEVPRPRIVEGDLLYPGLGLEKAEKKRLMAETSDFFHVAAVYDMGMSEKEATSANVEGTRRALEVASDLPHLKRFHYTSTLAVAGDYMGNFKEQDLDVGQGFDHAYGRSKFLAEVAVREAASSLPVTVYRPGVVVGNSQTGSMDKVDGPYFVFKLLNDMRRLPGITRVPMIVPREDDTLFHIVPVDFVVAALVELASLESSVGRTYHLMDPRPLSYREFYCATLREMGFNGPLISRPLVRVIRLIRKPPFWPTFRIGGRLMGMPAEMLVHFLYRVTYDTTNTQKDLEGSSISCPAVADYLPNLIDYYIRNMAG